MGVLTIVLVGLGLALYFIPAFVAYSREHHNAVAIFLVNLLLGWTFLGWVAALVWACTKVERPTEPGPAPRKATNEKTCPKCAELVKAAATICRFCNYDFGSAKMPEESAPERQPKQALQSLCPDCGEAKLHGKMKCACGYDFLLKKSGKAGPAQNKP